MEENAKHHLYRVVYVADPGGWRVLAASGEPATAMHGKLDDAVEHAKRLAEGHGWARIVVHDAGGLVERDFVFGSEHQAKMIREPQPVATPEPEAIVDGKVPPRRSGD